MYDPYSVHTTPCDAGGAAVTTCAISQTTVDTSNISWSTTICVPFACA